MQCFFADAYACASQTECSFWSRAHLLSLTAGCLAALALTMPLEVALYHLGAAGGAIHLGLRRGRAALALVGLETDPQLEVLSAPKALQQGAAAALKALFAPPLQRRLRTRRERQLGLLLGAALLHGQLRERAAQFRQALQGPELAALGRNACLQPSFVRQIPGEEAQELEAVPAQPVAAGLRVHDPPEAVPHAAPRAAGGEANLHKGGAADLEDVEHHFVKGLRFEPKKWQRFEPEN